MLASDFMIRQGIQGSGAFTRKAFKQGEVVLHMMGEIFTQPTRTSIQVGDGQHIEDIIGGHVNHSCYPNVRVDRETASLISLRDIAAGEEITFDYRQNEDNMASPFKCHCCGNWIRGKEKPKVASH